MWLRNGTKGAEIQDGTIYIKPITEVIMAIGLLNQVLFASSRDWIINSQKGFRTFLMIWLWKERYKINSKVEK